MVQSKTTGEQTAKGLKPIRQTAHGDSCECGKVWTNTHKPIKRFLAFYTFWFDMEERGCLSIFANILLHNLIWKMGVALFCTNILFGWLVLVLLYFVFHQSAAELRSAFYRFGLQSALVTVRVGLIVGSRGVRCRSKIKTYSRTCFC